MEDKFKIDYYVKVSRNTSINPRYGSGTEFLIEKLEDTSTDRDYIYGHFEIEHTLKDHVRYRNWIAKKTGVEFLLT